MEKDHDGTTLPSKSVVGGFGINEDVVAHTADSTTSTIEGEAVVSEEGAKVYASEEQIKAVFLNSVVSKQIISCFSFEDMKAARQVSQTFFEMIETCKRFKDAEVLVVTKENSPVSELSFLLNSDRIWRGIKIDFSFWTDDNLLKHISRILGDVEFVSLSITDSVDKNAFESIVWFIRDVLRSTWNIKHLQIEIILFSLKLRSVFECGAVRENLKTLKRLDITDKNNCCVSNRKLYESVFPSIPVLDTDVNQSLADKFQFLVTIFEQLESFCMVLSCDFEGLPTWAIKSIIAENLKHNRDTLKELSLPSCGICEAWEEEYNGITGIRALTFPCLRSFTTIVYESDQDELGDFLANHQMLEELDVLVDWELTASLLDVIILRSANLRKLHLSTHQFVESLGGREKTVDWGFLGGMTRLKDFKIVRLNSRPFYDWADYGNGAYFLQSLPPNQLERLSLEGIGYGTTDCGFWRYKHASSGLYDAYLDHELTSKLELLRRFRNLKRLSIRRCPDAVDDDIMQFIVREMTSLEELEVSGCLQLTDAGIAGNLEDGTDSIRNLKGLKELSIQFCPSVTPDGLLSCLRLQFLRHFEYIAAVKVTKPFVMKIMSQNPSLESVSVNLECPVLEFLEEVNNPRLKKLTNLTWPGEELFYADYDDSPDEESAQRIKISRWNLLFFSFVFLFIFIAFGSFCVDV